MLDLSPHDFAIWQARQHRTLQAIEDAYVAHVERLATDPIAAWMRTLRCDLCGCPVTECRCDGRDLPFAYEDEVTG